MAREYGEERAKAGYEPPLWSRKLHGEAQGDWMRRDVVVDKRTGEQTVWDNSGVQASRTAAIESKLVAMVNELKDPSQNGYQYLTDLLQQGDTGGKIKRSGLVGIHSFRQILQKGLPKLRQSDRIMVTPTLLKPAISREVSIAIFMKYGHDRHGRLPYAMFARRLFLGRAQQLSLKGCRQGAFRAKEGLRGWLWGGRIKYPICRSCVSVPTGWEEHAKDVCEYSACIGYEGEAPEAFIKLEHVFGYSCHQNVAPNLFYNSEGYVVYYTAAVGIVLDMPRNRQHFFMRHDDDIHCLAQSPADRDITATGQTGATPKVWIWSSRAVARGKGRVAPTLLQLPRGHRAVNVLCFSTDGEQLATLSTDNEHTLMIWRWRGQQVLCSAATYQGTPPMVFGAAWSGVKSIDSTTTPTLATWGAKHVLFWRLGGTGKKSISLPTLEASTASFGKFTQQDIVCACFTPPTGTYLLTGGPNGSVTVFSTQSGEAVTEISAHAAGRSDPAEPGRLLDGGCTALHVLAGSGTDGTDMLVVSGGGDGLIILWRFCVSGKVVPTLERKTTLDMHEADPRGPARMITSLHSARRTAGGHRLLCGDGENDIWYLKVSGTDDATTELRIKLASSTPIIEGHSADVLGLAVHPYNARFYITACTDGGVYFWDAVARRCLRTLEFRRQTTWHQPAGTIVGELLQARAVCFSKDGSFIALASSGVAGPPISSDGHITQYAQDHVDQGGVVQVWKVDQNNFTPSSSVELMEPDVLCEFKHNDEAIDAIKFSPDGRFLATGSHDNWVDIYDTTTFGRLRPNENTQSTRFLAKRTGRSTAHSSYISGLDWSEDSEYIQSTDGAYEILYCDTTGKAVTSDARDVMWETWTCVLGFDVMGIFQDGMDGTDINSVDRSKNKRFVLTAGDDGMIRLHHYPAVVEDAPGHAFKGHASHVAGVAFSSDDARAFSVGGRDRSLFQWRTHGIVKPSRHFEALRREHGATPLGEVLETGESSRDEDEEEAALLRKRAEVAQRAELRQLMSTLERGHRALKTKERQISRLQEAIKAGQRRATTREHDGSLPTTPEELNKLARENERVLSEQDQKLAELRANARSRGLPLEKGVSLWCYDTAAAPSFCFLMKGRYGDVSNANSAWGTRFQSWDDVKIPMAGTAKDAMWDDVLKWYTTQRPSMQVPVDRAGKARQKQSSHRRKNAGSKPVSSSKTKIQASGGGVEKEEDGGDEADVDDDEEEEDTSSSDVDEG